MPKSATKKVGDQEVQMDRRRSDRRGSAEKADDQSTKAAEPRRKQRRRQIDPTTCEREYTDQEIQFMQALDNYKRASGRMFPTCSEILEVIRDLGYTQLSEDERAVLKSIEEVETEIASLDLPESL